MNGKAWTPERVELLRQLDASGAGLTAAQMAKVLGGFDELQDGGRSTVQTKLLEIRGMGRTARRHGGASATLAAIDRRNSPAKSTLPMLAPARPTVERDPDEAPLEQRKKLLDLQPGDCRWPFGEVGTPGFFFCGGSAVPGLPYCNLHAAVAYGSAPAGRNQQERTDG